MVSRTGGGRRERRRGSRGVGRGKDPPGVYGGERRVQGSQREEEMRWAVGRRSIHRLERRRRGRGERKWATVKGDLRRGGGGERR